MRTLTLRTAALGAVLPLALASLAACGNGSSQATATDPQAGPSSSAPAAGTTTTAKPVGKAEFLALVRAASAKITTARFAMDLDLSGQSVPVKGVLDLTGESPAMQMTMDVTGSGTPTELRLVDKTMYVQLAGTDRFYKIDLNDPHGPMGSLGSGAFDNLDPGSLASHLSTKGLKKVTDRGVTTVGGQQLHRYSVVLDLGALGSLTDLPSTASLPTTAAYDVWLDDQGRFARFSMRMKNSMRMTATYSDYGTTVHVVAPPASAVTSMPGMSANG